MIIFTLGFSLFMFWLVLRDDFSYKTNISLFIFGIFLMIISYFTPLVTKEVKYDLVALSGNSAYNGQFFLGTGRVGNELQGTFAYKQDNIIRLKTVPISEKDQFIYTSESPKVIIYIRDKKLWKATSYCKFYIPEGSIKQNFNILGE